MKKEEEESEFNSLADQKYSLLHIFQTVTGAHTSSYAMGTGALSHG
jgi:hypothetical protein